MSKFFTVKVGGSFYIDMTPTPTIKNPNPERYLQICQKASSITYIDGAETYLGEVGYDPAIADKILTVEEGSKLIAAATAKKEAVKKAAETAKKKAEAAKNPVVKKSPTKKAVKPVKKAAAKKAAKKR